ncbi:hypothetical protein BN159_3853 [Streptomyces davaonensis JCM 4913]|uniref:Uncharacterized protein n=1 Tax=Streptomyces davaonensis (strain DSM 101723 / JCM 4913 / KCC S-0913 / 768) TaxID=1214101 RepID=K4R526_STRDJ|nr:hypothetical protein [Streptomyces davaonensis]CCK28232.1 hypothetical protein BN159_3853 [Streptomyces davaonensis JCM 4913]
MANDGAKPKVDNPERERLVKLKQQLEKERSDLVGALKRAATDIGKGGRDSAKAWVGKNADKWHNDVSGHRKTVRSRIDKVLEDIQREIDSMPAKVTPEEASSMNRNRRMY